MLALAAATCSFAQAPVAKQVMGTKVAEVKAPLMTMSAANSAVTSSLLKADAVKPDYVRYYVPTGTFFTGWDTSLRGWSIMLPVVSPFTQYTFENSTVPVDARPYTTWQHYGEDVSSSMVDADYNYSSEIDATTSPNHLTKLYYVPTLTYGTDSFNIAMFNEDYTSATSDTKGVTYLLAYDSIAALSPYNTGTTAVMFSGDAQLYGNTSLEFDYSDGEGKTTMYQQGVYQRYPKPMSTLYATDVHIAACAYGVNTDKIIDKALTMYVMDVKDSTITGTLSDGTDTTYTTKVQGDKILYTLTADPADQVIYGAAQGNTLGSIVFYNKQKNAAGGVSNAPIVLDQEYFLVIPTGFQSQTNKFNLQCSINGMDTEYNPSNQFNDGYPNSRMLLAKSKTGVPDDRYSLTYNYYRIAFCFNGIMDQAKVYTTNEANVQVCDATGGECLSKNEVDLVGDNYYGLVQTAMPWYNVEGDENYTVEFTDDANWVTAEVNEDARDKSGFTTVTFTCEPLPAGVTGRSTRAYVAGTHGVDSQDYFYILQGDATIADAINGVEINNKTANDNVLYNLAGQRVSKEYKGVVVKNGQKFINK